MMVPNSADIGERGQNVPGEAPISADALATRLGDIARELQQEEDPESVLAGIVHAALELVPHTGRRLGQPGHGPPDDRLAGCFQ